MTTRRTRISFYLLLVWDRKHSTSFIRDLEMTVDSICMHVGQQAYCSQFKSDCITYGLDEAKTYLVRFIESEGKRRNWGELPIIVMQDIAKLSTLIEEIRTKLGL